MPDYSPLPEDLAASKPATRATVRTSALDFKRMMLGLAAAEDLLAGGALEIDGDIAALAQLTGLFDKFERRFPIVTPREAWS